MYEHKIRQHIHTAQCAFVWLYINGEDWGLYPNVQQLNKAFLKMVQKQRQRWRHYRK